MTPALGDPALQATLRIALALLLLGSVRHKLLDFGRFTAAVADYRLLPASAAGLAAGGVVGAELAIGVALLVPGTAAAGAAAAAILLTIYSAAIAINLRRGRAAIDCGCGRPGSERPLSGALLLRNASLVLVAGVATLPAAARVTVWLDAITVAAGVAALSLLYAAVDSGIAGAARVAMRGRA